MRKAIRFLLVFFLLLPAVCLPAAAAEGDPEFRYALTIDGSETKEVKPGDIITVTLHLYRTDADSDYTMYAMQDEIRYDSEFFELVEDSAILSPGIQSTDIGLVDNHREFYMNYLSFSGGQRWDTKTRIGSFQLKVTGTSGVTTITNEDYLVSLSDGSGSYPCDANVLTVILSTDCTIRFETNGGSKIDPVTAIYGELLARPEDPIREGKHLVGWFKDIHLTEEWDFDNDTVKGNMTLYAKWADGDPVAAGKGCIICGRANTPIPGIPLCWICLLILLLLILLIIWLIYRHEKNKRKKNGKYERRDARRNEENKQ